MRVYLDHAATSPMSEGVATAYLDALRHVGNAASTHADGQSASVLLEEARRDIAIALGADTPEVVFTSGGTESINLALKGMFWARRLEDPNRRVVMLPATEHHASLEAAAWLESHEGASVYWIPVTQTGAPDPSSVGEAIETIGAANIALISFMWANNEVGTISPVSEIAAVAREHGIPCHVDAVAALGQVDIDFHASGATCMSISAHKIGGPIGTGALLMSREAKLESLFHGGSQQRSRAGTQDKPGAVAFAAALREATADRSAREGISKLRDELIAGVLERIPDARLRGEQPGAGRLVSNAHFTFPGCQGDSLLFLLDARGVSVSVGSACQAGVQEISHVLLAMGIPEVEAIGSLRMTLSAQTSREDVETFLRHLPQAVADAKKAGIVTRID